jgi:protein tyrosine phosphatase (PTP) superfamily phosphohydrolase (DUF442 family)
MSLQRRLMLQSGGLHMNMKPLVRALEFPILAAVMLFAFVRIALPFSMAPGALALNYVQHTSSVSSSGMPTTAQFARIGKAGFDVVIDLVPVGSITGHANERELVRDAGMAYFSVPVSFMSPKASDYEQFVQAVRQHDGARTLVHCELNMRASAFVFLFRVIELGTDPDEAFEDVTRIWQPASHWKAFMRDTLSSHGKTLPYELAS